MVTHQHQFIKEMDLDIKEGNIQRHRILKELDLDIEHFYNIIEQYKIHIQNRKEMKIFWQKGIESSEKDNILERHHVQKRGQ